MTYDDLDRQLAAWSAEAYVPPSPQNLAAVAERTRHLRQRQAWASLERWLPMTVISRPSTAPSLRAAWMAFVATVAVALAIGAAIIGANLLRSDASVELPPPVGPAGNGLIAHDGGGDIWVVRPDGTEQHRLTSGPALDMLPSWSPDGKNLAFWSVTHPSRTSMSINDADLIAEGLTSLIVIDSDGGRRRALASGLAFTWDYGAAPAWSPDSRRLAYSHLQDAVPVIDVTDVDGASPRRLAIGWTPIWSPEGSRIAYRGADDAPGLWVMASDGSDARKVNRTTGSGFAFTSPQWSLDERLITFYAGPDGAHDVWVARVDGSEEWVLGDDAVEEYWPAFSPDGSRVAFGRNIGPGCCDYRFVVSSPDGADQRTLDTEAFGASGPATWSPDGRYVLGVRGHEEGGVIIDVIDATGGSPEPASMIVATGDWVNLAWQRVAQKGPEDPDEDVAGLIGTWVLSSIDETAVPDDVHANVTFSSDGDIAGHSGCNVLDGEYELRTDVPMRAGFDGEITVTRLDAGGQTCGEAVMEVEAALVEGLRTAGAWGVFDGLLIKPPFGDDGVSLGFGRWVPDAGRSTTDEDESRSAQTDSMAEPRFEHTATLLPDGRVLLVGGGRRDPVATAELYDPRTGIFSRTGSMTAARSGHTATLLPDGRVLVVGCGSKDAEVFEPSSGSFSPVDLLAPHCGHQAVLLVDGRVLIAGGDAPGLSELYDPRTGESVATGPLLERRNHPMVVRLADRRVLFAGGGGYLGDGNESTAAALASAEIYDLASGTFTATGSMGEPRWQAGMRQIPGNTVMVVGGTGAQWREGASMGATSSAERYDIAKGTWSLVGSMEVPRAAATVTQLSDFRLLVAGGGDEGISCCQPILEAFVALEAEVWDPTSDSFAPAGSAIVGRRAHTATLLPDGRILLAGGIDEASRPLDSAEVFDPQR